MPRHWNFYSARLPATIRSGKRTTISVSRTAGWDESPDQTWNSRERRNLSVTKCRRGKRFGTNSTYLPQARINDVDSRELRSRFRLWFPARLINRGLALNSVILSNSEVLI